MRPFLLIPRLAQIIFNGVMIDVEIFLLRVLMPSFGLIMCALSQSIMECSLEMEKTREDQTLSMESL